MSQRTKDLLAAAAGPTGAADQAWHAASTSRLYFSDPRDINSAGQVDVIESDEPPPYVRIEAWVSPEMAAQIIGLITNEVQSVETQVRHSLRSELLQLVRDQVEREFEREQKAATKSAEPEHKPPPPDPRGVEARDTAARADLAKRDADRMKELTALVKEQADDEAAEAAESGEPAEVMADEVDTRDGEEVSDDDDEEAA